jgi:hypothetical protein
VDRAVAYHARNFKSRMPGHAAHCIATTMLRSHTNAIEYIIFFMKSYKSTHDRNSRLAHFGWLLVRSRWLRHGCSIDATGEITVWLGCLIVIAGFSIVMFFGCPGTVSTSVLL